MTHKAYGYIIVIIIFFTALAALVSGCRDKKGSDTVNSGAELSIFNYTHYDIADVSFKLASLPFSIETAPSAGSIYLRNTSFSTLPDGSQYSYVSNNCCFNLDGLRGGEEMRILWNVVYDLDAFNREGPSAFDLYSSRTPQPGSRWCTAIVKLPSVPTVAENLVFHILPDGEVVLTFSQNGDLVPLSMDKILFHRSKVVKGRYCSNDAYNPWFGLTRKKHVE